MSGGGKASAVIVGASGGIGAALEAALIEEGQFDVVHGLARSRTGGSAIDLTDEDTIAQRPLMSPPTARRPRW